MIEELRDGAGRLATITTATALTVGAATGDPIDLTAVTGLTVAAGTTLGALVTCRGEATPRRAIARVVYAIPGASALALLVAGQTATAVRWWEPVAVLVWAAGTWVLRPGMVARRILGRGPQVHEQLQEELEDVGGELAVPEPDGADVLGPDADHPLAAWWREHALDLAPGTYLMAPAQTGPDTAHAIIASGVMGEPVPEIPVPRLSARMDIPTERIRIGPVAGRGAGVRLLEILPEDGGPVDAIDEWAQLRTGLVLEDITVYEETTTTREVTS
ncbi:hypothetical protein SAMN06297387_13136 [Streptomyces zhaozhouensis]|uniref:Uncharacterized protein n=1 Tax=Streptomyces zhaozhouensis TaxID=1300267 RepID=A0A286E989_9ACTN|nr:hypothetical protein [Streptomyces zhaozhouensis]SOD67495.1 hypothetical protein SAMN06297387_13136 [Streptomyces zhaozhouensis]